MEGKLSPLAVKTASRSAWITGCCYALIIGAHFPVNFQATLIMSLLTLGLYQQLKLEGKPDWRAHLSLAAALINAFGFTFISNHRIQDLHWLVAYTIIVYLSLLVERNPNGVSHGLTFASHMFTLPFQKLKRCFRNDVWTNLCSLSFGQHSFELDSAKIGAGVISTFVLIVVGTLLSTVNSAFEEFMKALFTYIYDFIIWLFSIELIENAVIALFVAGLVYVCITPEENTGERQPTAFFKTSHYSIIVVPLLVMLFVFCCFQMEFLGINPHLLSYKDLSSYVRKGFFELLHVAVIGAFVWYFAERAPAEDENSRKRITIMLSLFAMELSALTLFSHHKLFVQQIIFGLRDQRVLASAGTLLLSGSFIGFLTILCKKLTHRQLLELQIAGLMLVTFTLSYGNLDGFISRYRPLQFEHKDRLYNDHAYLLTNSFDNSSDWLKYVEEVYHTGIILPQNYYWGVYEPICYKPYSRRNNTYSPFTTQLATLTGRYSPRKRTDVREIFKFNLREYLAYRHVIKNRETYYKFDEYLEVTCRETYTYHSNQRRSYHSQQRG